MLDRLFSQDIGDLQSALSRTSQRQAMLMTNMANVNVPGYKRQDMDFHVALSGQMDVQHQIDLKDMQEQRASDQTSLRPDGNNVDMEREVAAVNQTALHFEALTDFTSSYFAGLKSAIREGK